MLWKKINIEKSKQDHDLQQNIQSKFESKLKMPIKSGENQADNFEDLQNQKNGEGSRLVSPTRQKNSRVIMQQFRVQQKQLPSLINRSQGIIEGSKVTETLWLYNNKQSEMNQQINRQSQNQNPQKQSKDRKNELSTHLNQIKNNKFNNKKQQYDNLLKSENLNPVLNQYNDASFNRRKQYSKEQKAPSSQNFNDFFKQIVEAGIDICDLQSFEQENGKQFFFETSNKSQNNKSCSRRQDQISFKNQYRFKMQKFKNAITNLYSCSQQVKKLKSAYENLNEFLQQNKMKTFLQLKLLKSQSQKTIQKCMAKTNAALYQKQSKIKAHQLTIQQLRYRVLKLQTQILQKQTKNCYNIQKIRQLSMKNQQLAENLFDISQKLAQVQLSVEQRVKEFVDSFQNEKVKNLSEFQQKEINRLNEEVEELTRLYQHSQEQNKKAIQNQKLMIQAQGQKITKKQKLLTEKQTKIKINEDSLQKLKQNLDIKQLQLQKTQKIFQQKLIKVSQLQQQLNEGLLAIQQMKAENMATSENLQMQKQQMITKNKQLQNRLHTQSRSKSKNFGQFELYRQKSEVLDRQRGKNRVTSPLFNNQDYCEILQNQITENNQQEQYTFLKSDRLNNNNRDQQSYKVYNPYSNQNPYKNYSLKTQRPQNSSKPQFLNPYLQKLQSNLPLDYNFSKSNVVEYMKQKKSPQSYHTSQISSVSMANGHNGQLEFRPQLAHAQTHRKLKKSPNMASSLKKRGSDTMISGFSSKKHPMNKYKLNQLDHKIQALRSQIKKQISAAKSK